MRKQDSVAFARLYAGKAFALLLTVVVTLRLVLGFRQPKAAKADTPAYKLTDTLEAGQHYMIVNANTDGGTFALRNIDGYSRGCSGYHP